MNLLGAMVDLGMVAEQVVQLTVVGTPCGAEQLHADERAMQPAIHMVC